MAGCADVQSEAEWLDEDVAPKATYDFDTDIQPIFDANCVACHSGSSPPQGLDLSGNAYDNIVNVASTEAPALDLIEPNSTANSYLHHKIRGTHLTVGGSGVRMPQGGPYLNAATVSILTTWINEGALPSTTTCTDADADGSCVEDDCDDADASVFPGATEVAGDCIDQDCDGSDTPAASSGTYDYETDIQAIFNANCTSCHGGASPANGLDLTAGVSYDNIVNVASTELATMDFVEPGSTSTSYLYHKIRGTQLTVGGSGVRMPYGGPYLNGATIGIIATWITEGAAGPPASCTDADSDGYFDTTDCDDGDATVYPGATEIADDGIDQDCDGSDLVTALTYDYATDIQPVWDTYCTSCHSGASPSGGMSLANGVSYGQIVNVASSQLPSMDRVEPGDSNTSYLYRKLTNTHRAAGGSGTRMPPSGVVPSATQAMIATWIAEGAFDSVSSCTDADADGWCVDEGDCDDGDAGINPDATEIDGNGIDEDCDGTDGSPYTYSFADDVQPIFDAYCISCHSGSGAPLGLHLDAGNAWDETVNVASTQLASMDRIEPGNTTSSYLYRKITGTHRSAGGSGTRMPQGSVLPSADTAVIATWITEGAPDN